MSDNNTNFDFDLEKYGEQQFKTAEATIQHELDKQDCPPVLQEMMMHWCLWAWRQGMEMGQKHVAVWCQQQTKHLSKEVVKTIVQILQDAEQQSGENDE